MTKGEYEDFTLRYKGCGACFPMYHTLSRFEKMYFTAIQKDVAELEKENAELKRIVSMVAMINKDIYTEEGIKAIYAEAEQFLNEDKAETSEEPYYVIMNMNCQYEICRKCPKSGLFKGTYKECENWIKEKLSEVEK